MEIAKDIFYTYWKNALIFILLFFLIKSCQGSKDLQIANRELKVEVQELVITADRFVAKNNKLNDQLFLLQQQKQKVKTEIVYVQNKAKSEAEKVPTLNTKQIAKYYQERYKKPIVITKYGVSLSDTIAKKNIVELIEKDGCFKEVELFKTQLQLEEQKGIFKDTIIGNYTNANVNLNKAILQQKKIIDNAEKSVQKEKNKKTFWQVATGVVLAGAGYLLITQ